MKSRQTLRHGALLALAAMALIVVPRPAAAQPASAVSGGRNWLARSVPELIADINAANLAGGVNTITLARGMPFTLTAVNNTTDGATGLPVISVNNHLTIRGNCDTNTRSTSPATPAFRLIHVVSGAALTLENLTLANGQVIGDIGMDAGDPRRGVLLRFHHRGR